MTNEREALKLALEALELHGKQYPHMVKGIAAIKEALAQPSDSVEPEPVARIGMIDEDHFAEVCSKAGGDSNTPLYTTPYLAEPRPKREWVGLTDDQIDTTWKKWIGTERANKSYTLAIEAKLKEINHD